MGLGYVLIIVVILYLLASIRVLRQYERGVVFLLGKFEGVRGPGLTFIFLPFQAMVRVSLRTVTTQIPAQRIITKDNVSIDIAAVAYYHISDPERAVIAIENVYNAINQISQTTVRNIVGRFNLDQLLSDTASVNEQIKNVIDGHTEPWGVKVTSVEDAFFCVVARVLGGAFVAPCGMNYICSCSKIARSFTVDVESPEPMIPIAWPWPALAEGMS